MTSAEQKKIIQSLKQVIAKMTSDEKSFFEMIVKRDKDDEDLDSMSFSRLKQLFSKYFPSHTKEEIEARWKKIFGDK